MKLEIKKIKKVLNKILKKLWQNLFLILIFLLFLDLIIGGIFFWKYYLLVKKEEPQIYIPLGINQALLEKVSSGWEEREAAFKTAQKKEYPNPFHEIQPE